MSGLAALERVSTTEQVVRALRAAIVSGSIAQGEQLREVQLATQLGTGRSAVREALRQLVQEGLAHLCKAGHVLEFREPDLLAARPVPTDPRRLVSPVSGIAIKVLAAAGEKLNAGDAVAIIEAMKMETRVVAGADGRVAAMHVAAGAQVVAGDVIAEIEPSEAKSDG